jgi:hypothetical protein
MKRSILLLICSFFFSLTNAQNIATGSWRIHLPYNDVLSLAETPVYIYVAAEKGLYSFHKKSGEVELFSKLDGFSDVEPILVRYQKQKDLVVIVYKNTNIDILKGTTVFNIPDILRKTILGIKEIYDINFDGNFMNLSCSFGVVQIDLDKFEVKDSYLNIGPGGTQLSINSFARYSDTFFVATNQGIFFAPSNGVNHSDFNSWKLLRTAAYSDKLRVYNGRLYAVVDSVLQYYKQGSWQYFRGNQKRFTSSIEINYDKLIVAQHGGIIKEDLSGAQDSIRENIINYAILDFEGSIWTGGNFTGLAKIDPQGNYSYVKPNGPARFTSHTMLYDGKQIWVSSGGTTGTWAPTFNNGGYYRYNGVTWTNRPDVPNINPMYDFTALAMNKSGNDVWLGSHGVGLLHLNNGRYVNHYSDSNSTLQRTQGGFVFVLGLGVDSKNNVWAANYEGEKPLSVRFADGTWKSFTMPNTHLGEMVIDKYDQKWMIVPRDNNYGICVFKENDPLANTFTVRLLDKNKGSGSLPSSEVNALAIDKDGEIWIGTDEGLAVIYNPGNVFKGGDEADAQRFIIDDGKDIGYLLGTEVINDIAVDGANRKWIASNNGVWLIEEDGSKVIRHFSTSNSPLLSNTVKSIGINGKSGEVFFGTEKGIISYRSDATEADDVHGKVTVFPNPVRENYNGPITINGLPADATVKITDIAGRLVYEMVADGGTAVWNGKGFNGKRPATGIYLIFTANKEDEDALVSKLLIVN